MVWDEHGSQSNQEVHYGWPHFPNRNPDTCVFMVTMGSQVMWPEKVFWKPTRHMYQAKSEKSGSYGSWKYTTFQSILESSKNRQIIVYDIYFVMYLPFGLNIVLTCVFGHSASVWSFINYHIWFSFTARLIDFLKECKHLGSGKSDSNLCLTPHSHSFVSLWLTFEKQNSFFTVEIFYYKGFHL